MIEVNLHPERGKARRSARRGFPISLPRSFPKLGGTGAGERDVWTTVAIAVPVLALLVIGWLWFSQRSQRSELETRIETAVEDSTRLADLRSLSDSLISRRAHIGERLELVSTLDQGRFVWPHLLDEISRALPAYTWLTAVRQSRQEPDLEVQVDGLAANPLAITRFVRGLQESPFIGDVRILGSQQELVENVAAQAFKLMVIYEQPPAEVVRTEPVVENF